MSQLLSGKWQGATIQSRDGKVCGTATGAVHRCRLEGCTGLRVSVKWHDGRTTFPCSKGLEWVGHELFRIE